MAGTIIAGLVSGCEIIYSLNADGTVSAHLRLPFVEGFDPRTLVIRIRLVGRTVACFPVSQNKLGHRKQRQDNPLEAYEKAKIEPLPHMGYGKK